MKHIIFNRHDAEWMATVYLNTNGVCEVTIDKKRTKKKWYQSEYGYFMDFLCVPESLEELETHVYMMLDKKFLEVKKEQDFQKAFSSLEDVSYFESKSC